MYRSWIHLAQRRDRFVSASGSKPMWCSPGRSRSKSTTWQCRYSLECSVRTREANKVTGLADLHNVVQAGLTECRSK